MVRKFKVICKWPKVDKIQEEFILAEHYYKKSHTYTFVNKGENEASFPTKVATIVEITQNKGNK